ncbi:hypothetical protein K501DRAFT_276192 [Backusella circina FSU 941]|nr:hypothetical protein K501DRAFT_276192 [Backusella circina FSU 941]
MNSVTFTFVSQSHDVRFKGLLYLRVGLPGIPVTLKLSAYDMPYNGNSTYGITPMAPVWIYGGIDYTSLHLVENRFNFLKTNVLYCWCINAMCGLKPTEKETPANNTIKKVVELTKPIDNGVYKDYNDQTREVFIDRMIEGPMERGKVTLHAKDLGINPRTAMRWWKYHEETGEVAYKRSQRNSSRPNSFTPEHEQHIQQIVGKDSQLCTDNIIDSLTSQFENFKISKSQMNHHLRNNMLITIKKPTFDPKARNSENNLQTRYESTVGTPVQVEIEKTRSPSHTIIGAIHCTSVIRVVMKKPPPKQQRGPKIQTSKMAKPKKRKPAGGKE